MVNAIQKGKAGHWLKGVDDDTHWRDSVPTYEDYLTAAFFEIYFKLPSTLLAEINQKLFPEAIDKFAFLHQDDAFEYEFWPRFYLEGRSLIEPDVIVISQRLKKILIIEAKIEFASQKSEQLRQQFDEIGRHYGDSYSIWIWAIGGQRNFPETGGYYSHVKWQKVFDTISKIPMPYRYAADLNILRQAFGFENLSYSSMSGILDFPAANLVWPIWPDNNIVMQYVYGGNLPKSLGNLWM